MERTLEDIFAETIEAMDAKQQETLAWIKAQREQPKQETYTDAAGITWTVDRGSDWMADQVKQTGITF